MKFKIVMVNIRLKFFFKLVLKVLVYVVVVNKKFVVKFIVMKINEIKKVEKFKVVELIWFFLKISEIKFIGVIWVVSLIVKKILFFII